MKQRFLYIHGLNSDATSRKYLNLKEYFKDEFEFDCLEWKNEDTISELLSEAESELENHVNPILFGDSTGANFAWQLRERRMKKGQKSILILSSPLLDLSKRIADFEFPKKLIPFMNIIHNPKDTLVIASETDEVIDMSDLLDPAIEKDFELIKANDTHRLVNFKSYLPEIRNYIDKQNLLQF